jgi:hypothetical protein|tara:strand:- start:1024 stop:1743 length:720 start_codon:yes stop_codon:yes gene_type:complete
MEPLKELEGAHVALIGLGTSQIDYVIGRENSVEWDETWGCGSSAAVFQLDRLFMMDPASRFLDTEDAGKQTEIMRKILPELNIPIYSCELDERVPSIIEYPLDEIVEASRCAYMNNTVAYAVAFAYWNNVRQLDLFGIDFSYKGNLHFAEAGRACVEFWLSKCIEKDIKVGVSPRSSLLDSSVAVTERLYGYHRLEDPKVAIPKNNDWFVCNASEMEDLIESGETTIQQEPRPPEPYKG